MQVKFIQMEVIGDFQYRELVLNSWWNKSASQPYCLPLMPHIFLLSQRVFSQEKKNGLWNQKGLPLTGYVTWVYFKSFVFVLFCFLPMKTCQVVIRTERETLVNTVDVLSFCLTEPFLNIPANQRKNAQITHHFPCIYWLGSSCGD